jgi:uncharacterized protein (DUF58 family)
LARNNSLTFNGWPIVPLLVLLIGLQIVAPSRVWMTLVVGLGATLGIGWVWARQMQKHVHLTREKRYTWTHVGDRLEERFTLVNDSPLPALWVEVQDGSTLPGYQPNWVTGVEANGSNRWLTAGICQQRGVFNLGPTTLRLGDPFGLFVVLSHYPGTHPLLVMPTVLELPGIQIASGGLLNEGRPRPYAPQPTILAASVQEYRPGDSLRLIHWPTSARRGSWFVRTFDGSPAGAWWIILDLDERAHRGQGLTSTLEQGVTLAASLVELGLEAGHPVGFIAHSREPIWQPPLQGDSQRWAIMRTLATIKPGPHPLEPLLRRSGETLAQTASLIVITPAAEPDWLAPLQRLHQRGLVPTALLLTDTTTQTSMQRFRQFVAAQGIAAYLMEPDTLVPHLDPASAEGQWEWHISATGRASARHRPQGTWEVLR